MNHFAFLKKIGLFAIIILTVHLAFSQQNYLPAYIIRNNTDTVFGYVDYRNWQYNPQQIMFKPNMDELPVSYSPLDVTEFKVSDEMYVSGIVETEVSPYQTGSLKYDPQIILKVDTVFLQTLIGGAKSLYYYKSPAGKENFYIKQDTVWELLSYKRYLKQIDGKPTIAEIKKYLGQLVLYFDDCTTIHSRLEKTSYNQKSLTKLFQYYYECSPSDFSFQKIEKNKTEIGVLAGVSSTSLSFAGYDMFNYLVDAGFNPSHNFSSGVFFDFILPRTMGKWSINNEILFTTYQVQGSYNDFTNENHYSLSTTHLGYSYLKINNLVRFKYPLGRLFFLFNAGITNGFSIDEKNYQKKEVKFYTTERVVEEPALNDSRKHEQGLVVGTGVKYNRYSVEIRFEQANGMAEYKGLKSITHKYYFLMGYRF